MISRDSLESKRQAAGHYHIEGYCVYKMGRTWAVYQERCYLSPPGPPIHVAAYRQSLDMVRDYILSVLQ
jgi:hypothetical protein